MEDLNRMTTHLGLNPNLNCQIDTTCSASHYKSIYVKHYKDCRDFFSDKSEKFFYSRLEDNDLFEKICRFLGLSVGMHLKMHSNKSSTQSFAHLNQYLSQLRRNQESSL
jgi:hypothetical protein